MDRDFEKALDESRAALVRIAKQYAGANDWQDLLQEMSVALWRGLPRFDGRARLSTCVYRVAINIGPSTNWTDRFDNWRTRAMIDSMRVSMTRTAGLGLIAAGLLLAAGARAEAFDAQAWIDEQVRGNETLSISAARVVKGDVAYFRAGPVNADAEATVDAATRYQIGSLTKAFTHLLLAEMVALGEVDYDTTVADLIGNRVEFANANVGRITLLELATHTSGLPRLPANLAFDEPADPYAGYDEEDLLAAIASARHRQPLGDHYAYSNFGVGLLGYLLGRVDGDGYAPALTRRVLAPMALADTELDPENRRASGFSGGEVVRDWTFDAIAGAGALWSSAEDLVRVARVMLGSQDNPLEHSLDADREVIEPDSNGYAVTRVWHVAESPDGPIYWHNGGTGGFRSFFGFRSATDEAIILLVSGRADPTEAGMRWLDASPARANEPDLDTIVTGQYELDGGAGIGVFERNGKIMAQLAGQSAQQVTAVGDGWYAYDVADASLRFINEGGAVTAVELVQHGLVQRAERVGDRAEVLTRAEVSLTRNALREFVGEYAINANAKFTIRLADDSLEAKLTGQQFLPIHAKGDDVFFYKIVDAELHFERDDTGKVAALVLHQGGVRQRAERIN